MSIADAKLQARQLKFENSDIRGQFARNPGKTWHPEETTVRS